jgi:hypothetical protein
MKFEKDRCRWKVNLKIYKVMFHEVWLITIFTRSKRIVNERLESWTKIKARHPRRKNFIIALLGNLMNILFQQIK